MSDMRPFASIRVCLIACLAMSGHSATVSAQEAAHTFDNCGTFFSEAEGVEGMRRHLSGVYDTMGRYAADEVYTVRIRAHIVRQDDGSGGLPLSQLTQAMSDANDVFKDAQMRFVLDPVLYVDDDTYFFANTSALFTELRNTNLDPDAIDIFFVPSLVTQNGSYCGISAFTFSSSQSILMDNDCTGLAINPSTFPHEIGHYFDLFHTHEPFYGLECVSRTNCTSTGDLLCDTPADPVLGQSNAAGCVYSGTEMTAAPCPVEAYVPDASNLMSYAPKHCRDHFTAGQSARARATLQNLRPNYISFTHVLSPADIDGDLVVDGADLATLLSQWGTPGPADFDGNGIVDGADLAELLAGWSGVQ